MHKLVGSVFKVLGVSIIMMALLDTGLMVMETISVHNKLLSISGVIQNEIARNNCVPNAVADLFNNQINSVVSGSRGSVVGGVTSNIGRDIVIKGVSYPSVGEVNVKQYGQTQTLAISVNMQPTQIMLWGRGSGSTVDGSFIKKNRLSYNINYIYTVPCLRYLK